MMINAPKQLWKTVKKKDIFEEIELTQRRTGEAQRTTEKRHQVKQSFVNLSVTFVSLCGKKKQ
jgi:hypothetical protein